MSRDDQEREELPLPHEGMSDEDKGELLLRYVRAGRSVAGLDFSNADLREQNLTNADLSGVIVTQATFWMADLTGASLRGVDLTDTWFADVARDGFHSNAAADFATCARSGWNEDEIEQLALRGLDFDWDTFPEPARVRFCGLPEPHEGMTPKEKGELLLRHVRAGRPVAGLDFSGANVNHRDLSGADLSGGVFVDSKFYQARLVEASFVGADMRFAYMSDAECMRADFSGVRLSRARMSSTNFTDATFEGADLLFARITPNTYRKSGWTPDFLLLLKGLGLEVVNLDEFPSEARHAILGSRQGLTLTFDTRLHRFASSAVEGLILEVLGPDTDVGVEEQSRPDAEGPGFVRINGSSFDHLLRVAEAFYARAWEWDSQDTVVSRLLTDLRDEIREAAVNHPDVQEMLLDQAGEQLAKKDRNEHLRGRWERLLHAIKDDTLDRAKNVIGERTVDALSDAGKGIIEDVQGWWDQRQALIWARRVDAIDEREWAGLIEDKHWEGRDEW